MSEPLPDARISPSPSAREIAKAARTALGPLQRRAKRGDHAAVVELRDLALSIIGTLDTLTSLDPASLEVVSKVRIEACTALVDAYEQKA